MANYTGPKSRLYRKVGLRIQTHNDISQNHPTIKKAYPPGMHGAKSGLNKKSEFAKQLLEKQKAKVIHNLTEKQFKRAYENAIKMDGIAGDNLLTFLETRLDNVIFRSGIAVTRYQARQMVSHGLIELNGKKASIPSIQVKVGDQFSIINKKEDSPNFKKNSELSTKAPNWLNVNLKNLQGEVTRLPDPSELEQQIQANLIVEFYSK